jgi:hypothetical protein
MAITIVGIPFTWAHVKLPRTRSTRRRTWPPGLRYPLPLWISLEAIGKVLSQGYDSALMRGDSTMAQELMIDVHRNEISISVRGTCLKMTCRKNEAPWGLTCTELRGDDPEAIFTRDEFKTLAWTTANAKARELGWIA